MGKKLDNEPIKIHSNAQILWTHECSISHFRLFPKWNTVRSALIKIR